MTLFSTLIIVFASAVAFFSGLTKILKHKGVALYYQLIVAAAGCLMLGKVYELTNIIIIGELPNTFHIGYLGAIACFLFLLSANYGQIDSLIDTRGSELRKYRVISMIAPVLLIIMGIFAIQHIELLEIKIITIVTILPIVFAARLSLKHIIIPDPGDGFIKAIRPTNIIVLSS